MRRKQLQPDPADDFAKLQEKEMPFKDILTTEGGTSVD